MTYNNYEYNTNNRLLPFIGFRDLIWNSLNNFAYKNEDECYNLFLTFQAGRK